MQFDAPPPGLVSLVPQIARRSSLWWRCVAGITTLAVLWALGGRADAGDEKFDLAARCSVEAVYGVNVVIEVNGDLNLNADGKQVDQLPLRVAGRARYRERTLRPVSGDGSRRDARHYDEARATIAIGDTRLETRLRDQRQLIIADASSATQTLYSPLGPLTRDELELIQTPGSSALLDRLAPPQPVALNAEWTHAAQDLAPLLGLDAIHQCDVKSTLRQVEGNVAIIDMSGKVSGAIDGVASDISLRAKYNIHLQLHRVTWLAMSLREVRAIGHATPGFDVTARVRVEIDAQPSCPELSVGLLEQLPLELNSGSTLLRLDSPLGGFGLLHARDWQMMVDRHDVTILRMIEQGELIAQCNISSLPDLDAGKRVQLADFQADIERALGKNFGQFVEASQQKSDNGHRMLRAVVSGLASELPIQWIYYHLSDDRGRQAALVFTMDAKLVEKFAGADQSIVGTFEFTQRTVPTPASTDAKATAARPSANTASTAR